MSAQVSKTKKVIETTEGLISDTDLEALLKDHFGMKTAVVEFQGRFEYISGVKLTETVTTEDL